MTRLKANPEWDVFTTKMIYEAGQATGGIDLDTLTERHQQALDEIHRWEYIHALVGLAIALANNEEGHQHYWLNSLQSIAKNDWLKGRNPESPYALEKA